MAKGAGVIDLTQYDWAEVISYAGPGCVSVALGSVASADPLVARDDDDACGAQGQRYVRIGDVEVMAYAEGENDGANWLLVFATPDGRWWFTSAGCDFTGWDCQAGGHTIVSHSRDHLVRYALDDDARSRLIWKDGVA